MEEIKPIIRVDVGESEQTVKGLKKEISELKDRILNLKKGSDDYNDAVEQLQADQRKLNEVMALTKKEAVAVEGSYDALTHQMSLLKKEWRATADEAKRADLGKQIDDINQQLKEMDASVGNFQRNVGNYVSHWEGMPEVTKDFGAAMREMNEQIEPTKQKFESVGKIASGLAGGFAAVQGAMALVGIESKDFEKTMIKVQAAMAIAQGIGGLGGLVEGLGKAKVAFQGVITSIRAVTAAMSATGWLAVIVAVSAALVGLISWIKKSKEASDELKLSLEEQKEMNNKLGESIGDVISEYKIFQKEYSKLGSEKEKKEWIEENASAFEKMGLNIKDVNDADDAFINKTPQVVAALKARAKAEALTQLYKDAIVESEKKKANYTPQIPNQFVEGSATDAANGKYPAELEGFEDYYTLTESYQQGGTVSYMRKKGVTEEQLKGLPIVQQKREEAFAEFNEMVTLYEGMMDEANEAALAAEKALGDLAGGKNDDDDKVKTADEIRDELVAKVLADTEKELLGMSFDENIDLSDSKIDIKEDKGGLYEKLANDRIASIERVAQRELELNNASKLSDEEKAQKELEITQKLEEDKLRILQEFKQKAKEEGDWQSDLELQQDIADQEVAITVAKNEKIIQSEQQRKEKTQKILSDVSAAISAAGQLTQGIMEIAQAKAEEDGEISEEEAKKIKGLQYATATINMLQGAITAFSSAMQLGPIIGPILGGVNAAAVIAMGTANLMKIKNTDITGSVSSGAQAAVTPNSNVYGTDIPFSYTKQVTGASEIDALNQDTRVYILESDIQESNKKVQVRESESSF